MLAAKHSADAEHVHWIKRAFSDTEACSARIEAWGVANAAVSLAAVSAGTDPPENPDRSLRVRVCERVHGDDSAQDKPRHMWLSFFVLLARSTTIFCTPAHDIPIACSSVFSPSIGIVTMSLALPASEHVNLLGT